MFSLKLRRITIICVSIMCFLAFIDAGDKSYQYREYIYTSPDNYKKREWDKEVEAKQEQEIKDLAVAVYHESGNQSSKGKAAVAKVILNRAKIDNTTVKNVVTKKGQFQYIENNRNNSINITKLSKKELTNYNQSIIIANDEYQRYLYEGRMGTKATYFKRCSTSSSYFDKLKFLYKIEDHCFFMKGK